MFHGSPSLCKEFEGRNTAASLQKICGRTPQLHLSTSLISADLIARTDQAGGFATYTLCGNSMSFDNLNPHIRFNKIPQFLGVNLTGTNNDRVQERQMNGTGEYQRFAFA